MRNDVMINGIKYVPLSKKPNVYQINRLSSILTVECPYLSRSAKNNIINKFKEDDEVKNPQKSEVVKSKKPQKSEVVQSKIQEQKPQKPIRGIFEMSNFNGFDNEGHIKFLKNRGRKKSVYTMKQIIDVNQWLKFGKSTPKKICESVGITNRRYLYIKKNLEHGCFNQLIELWHSENRNKKPPVENNPQKRKEIGWY